MKTSHVPGDAAQYFAVSTLDYACKTRTVDDYLIVVSACLKETRNDVQAAYERACRNVFFSHEWRSQVHSSVALFLSPGQASRLANDLLRTATEEWEKVHVHLQATVRRQATSEYRPSVTIYALLLSYVTDILCALFDRSAASPGLPANEDLSRIVQMCDAVDSILSGAWSSRKTILWEHHVLQACTLRCRYVLGNVWNSPNISLPPGFDDLYAGDVASPELRFELVRLLNLR